MQKSESFHTEIAYHLRRFTSLRTDIDIARLSAFLDLAKFGTPNETEKEHLLKGYEHVKGLLVANKESSSASHALGVVNRIIHVMKTGIDGKDTAPNYIPPPPNDSFRGAGSGRQGDLPRAPKFSHG